MHHEQTRGKDGTLPVRLVMTNHKQLADDVSSTCFWRVLQMVSAHEDQITDDDRWRWLLSNGSDNIDQQMYCGHHRQQQRRCDHDDILRPRERHCDHRIRRRPKTNHHFNHREPSLPLLRRCRNVKQYKSGNVT